MAFYRYFIIIWLLCFGTPVYCYQTPAGSKNANSLTVADYDKLISRYRYYKPDSAIYYTKQAIALATRNKDDNGLAKVLNQLGMIQDNLGKFDESHQNYLTAKHLYERTGNKKGIATELIRIGVVDSRKGNYDKALGYFLQSLKLAEQNGNTAGRMEAYLTIAEVYMFQHKVDTSLNFLLQAEAINQTLPFSNLTLNIYNNFGVLYREKGEYEKARYYLEKGLALSNKPELQGHNITLTNTLAALYAKQGFKDKSIQLQLSALAKSRAIHNYIREYQTLINIAATYGKENAPQALIYLKQALLRVQEKDAKKEAIEILGRMADLYHYLNDDKQAYNFKQQQYAIANTYYFQGMAKQISSLQAQYDLNKSEVKVQQLKYINARQSLETRVIMAFALCFILLLAIMALSYYRTSRLNRLLNKANTDLQETNTVKDKLFSVLAHDLRAPFSTIIGLLQVINDDDIEPDERKELIDMVSVTSTASLDILNNLLKWGEMQIKGIRLNPVNLNPDQLIERSISVLLSAAKVKSIQLHNQVQPNSAVITDPDHFEFVLRNLLGNAVKFTPAGGSVTISSHTDTLHNEIQFTVADNGIGIQPERINHIFDLSNVSTDGTNDEKGTSLGLVLCKEFIEANHGRIWVESQPGQGSRFIFSLKRVV